MLSMREKRDLYNLNCLRIESLIRDSSMKSPLLTVQRNKSICKQQLRQGVKPSLIIGHTCFEENLLNRLRIC